MTTISRRKGLPSCCDARGSTMIADLPRVDELNSLPLRSQVAFAARCAWRVRPWFANILHFTSSPRSDVLQRWSQATGPCEGITAHRCLCVRTGSGITEARPHPQALLPPRTTWAKSAIRVYSVLQSKWPLRAPSVLEPVAPTERDG